MRCVSTENEAVKNLVSFCSFKRDLLLLGINGKRQVRAFI